MTQYPEAYLARELGLCYATIALVTDYDTGVEDDPSIGPGEPRRGLRGDGGERRHGCARCCSGRSATCRGDRAACGCAAATNGDRTRPVASPSALPPPAPCRGGASVVPFRPRPGRVAVARSGAGSPAGPCPGGRPPLALAVATGLVADGLLQRATDAEARWGTTRTVARRDRPAGAGRRRSPGAPSPAGFPARAVPEAALAAGRRAARWRSTRSAPARWSPRPGSAGPAPPGWPGDCRPAPAPCSSRSRCRACRCGWATTSTCSASPPPTRAGGPGRDGRRASAPARSSSPLRPTAAVAVAAALGQGPLVPALVSAAG